ncbi:MAG: prepilin-type N-terminal cleavage/methylation domain-containing protein [Candidatus Omnitrophica bacterium]|nr:prepilin-type N-terminal cleavage/methylation domain-containing protein [Candidatus Omnitrophota bacterium]
MKKNRKGFTLIELIIVVVIVGILALVAIPRYFANIEKARKAEALSSMRSIREAIMGYYAANNAYPTANSFPITVNIDGDDVMVVEQPSSTNFAYSYTSTVITAAHTGAGVCTYTMNIASGSIGKSPASCP